MPLSIFIDALPYNEITENYKTRFEDMQIAELLPNIAYSSSLHWQLYCDKYPDERGVLVDWVKEPEKNRLIRFLSTVLTPLDSMGDLGVIAKKVLDRFIFRKNAFANIPFKFRKDFSEKGKYLFWDKETYGKEDIFKHYTVVSQDEGHLDFDTVMEKFTGAIENGDKNIFGVFGFADALGHKCARGKKYSERLKPYMEKFFGAVDLYRKKHPDEQILIASDHGMSTVQNYIDLSLGEKFGKQGKDTYIAYCDTAVMCIWCQKSELCEKIKEYLCTRTEGHLLTDGERNHFGAADKKFGDIIYILKEGNIFEENWFGKSLKKPSSDGFGMHGFYPDINSKDQNACIILIGGKQKLFEKYDYRSANLLINDIMKEEK